MKISVILRKPIQQMLIKKSQNLGVKWNVLLLLWYSNCSKEALLDQYCWSQLVCLILMFCRAKHQNKLITQDKLITQFKILLKVMMNLSAPAASSSSKALSETWYIKFVQEDERLGDFYFKKLNARKQKSFHLW